LNSGQRSFRFGVAQTSLEQRVLRSGAAGRAAGPAGREARPAKALKIKNNLRLAATAATAIEPPRPALDTTNTTIRRQSRTLHPIERGRCARELPPRRNRFARFPKRAIVEPILGAIPAAASRQDDTDASASGRVFF
jgi:hypothetical protein